MHSGNNCGLRACEYIEDARAEQIPIPYTYQAICALPLTTRHPETYRRMRV